GDLVAETLAETPADPRAAGDAWLASGRSALLRAPSFVVPESADVLVNSAHRDVKQLTVALIRSFAFDSRLWPSPRPARRAAWFRAGKRASPRARWRRSARALRAGS